jgi:4-amino-4-deoxy-L-arabinose transferase-like glycosyltransferase
MLDETATNRDQAWAKAPLILLLLLVVFSLVYYFSNLGSDLLAAGEARAAEIAREMLERGNFILPSLNHVVYAESLTKPPLYHWLLIAVAAPFDWANWAVRLTSVVISFCTIWLVFQFGRSMFGKRAAVISALVLTTNILFLENSSVARMDILFSFLILAAIYCFWMALSRGPETKWLYGFYALSGMAVLTKGPVGVLFPLAIAVSMWMSNPGVKNWRQFVPLKGVLLFFAVALPWYILMAVTAPPELASNFLFGQLAQWWVGSSDVAEKGGQPLTYYLPHILIGLFPWSLFLPMAIVVGIRAARQENGAGIKSMLIWFLGGFILFSLGGKKASRYLLPLIPPFALMMGFYWDKVAEALSKRHGWALQISSSMVLLLAMVLALLLVGIYTDNDWVMQWLFKGRSRGGGSSLSAALDLLLAHPLPVVATISAVIVSSLLAVVSSIKRNVYMLVFSLAAVIWSLVWPYDLAVRPTLKQQFSPRPMAKTIASILPQDGIVYAGGRAYQHSMRWYLQRNLKIETELRLYDRVLKEPSSWVLLMENDPLQDKLLASGRKRLQWQIDYYYVSLFPGTPQKSVDR